MRDRVKRFMTRLTFSISTLSYTVYLSSLRSCGVTAEFSMKKTVGPVNVRPDL